ncbi:hypothetical protein AURDEDRAFT_181254 [Auricularia subglabra TFB-10046 SS5]|nr:hypothetical protein AURDEDRAFT_181254 [Auricularia subglabra TFB-10046 SS5]
MLADMAPTLSTLPDNVLDDIVRRAVAASPLLRAPFLAALGSRLHASAARVLFEAIVIPDDMRAFSQFAPSTLGPLAALIRNPARYEPAVRRLRVQDPSCFENFELPRQDPAQLLQFDADDAPGDDGGQGLIAPLDAGRLDSLLAACPRLTELRWLSSTPPPDGLCEALATHNSKLTTLAFTPEPSLVPLSPQIPAHARFEPPRWDAPSLHMLAALPLTHLHLSRLSQAGARSLGILFSKLGDLSNLEDVALDFLWLDDSLCDKLVEASKRLRHLRLSTHGTKLSDRGVLAILEGVDGLEELEFVEVEGRLSKKLWEKAELPLALTALSIRISEAGQHHSWIADHLYSLPCVSFASLTKLSVARTFHPFDRRLDDVALLSVMPSGLAFSLREAKSLETLECDWWAWKSEDLKVVLDGCHKLQALRIAFDDTFAKFLGLTSIFAPAPQLRDLHVYISPSHAPLIPATPMSLYMHPMTPSASPVVSSSTSLPSATVSDSPPIPAGSSLDDKSGALEADPHLPPLREVKKFVRRCQALTRLEWYGWNGRGTWIVTRPPGATKSTINVTVEHFPPSPPSAHLLEQYALEEQASGCGWLPGTVEREGHAWTGPQAEEYFAERQAEKEREEVTTPVKKTRKASSASASYGDVTVIAGLPLTPASSMKAFSPPPLTPLKIMRDSPPAEPLSPKSPPTQGRHRRSTTESSVGGDRTAHTGASGAGRRKSTSASGTGGGSHARNGNRTAGSASLNGSHKSPTNGARQNPKGRPSRNNKTVAG